MWHILKHYTPLKIPVSKWNKERQISTRRNGTLHTEKQSGEPSRELSQPTHRSCIFFFFLTTCQCCETLNSCWLASVNYQARMSEIQFQLQGNRVKWVCVSSQVQLVVLETSRLSECWRPDCLDSTVLPELHLVQTLDGLFEQIPGKMNIGQLRMTRFSWFQM